MTRYGVPASAIAEANNIPNGTALKPGQRLVIPKYEVTGSTAPRAASNAPHAPAPAIGAPATSSSQHVHVVAPGETLMALSRKYHKPLGEIAKANNIEPHTMVKVGDRIVIPGVRARRLRRSRRCRRRTAAEARRPRRRSPRFRPRRAAQRRDGDARGA